jgi:3-hydroxy-9,10-secoandrosta-1,3,5(10)-triene-9,17-dione monooxygenase
MTAQIPTIDDLLARAIAMRPRLRALQAETEERTYPSTETYEAFKAAGFFRVMTPRTFGGYEMSLKDYYRLVIEISRGCPSTGWWYALGAAHTVQICSYCAPETQRKVFALDPDFSGPWTFSSPKGTLVPDGDGYRIDGVWHFASGGPHASIMMAGFAGATGKYGKGDSLVALVPRGQFEVLPDWGDIVGMQGSGSNSVRMDNVFVPADMVFEYSYVEPMSGPTPGSDLHGNAFYGGLFAGFAEGGLAAVAVGTGLAALDEYEHLLRTRDSVHNPGMRRIDDREFLRKFGMAVASLEMTRGAVLHGAETYLRHSELSVAGKEPFDMAKARTMDGAYHAIENTVFDVIDQLSRASSSTAFRKGQKMLRYYRDILTLTSRGDFFEFRAAELAKLILHRDAAGAGAATPP